MSDIPHAGVPDEERPIEDDDDTTLLPDRPEDGDPGLPPDGDDPMDGAAPSG